MAGPAGAEDLPRSMTGRILHISDLHLGRGATSEPLTALRQLIPVLAPETLVVTGDLTHRGRRPELELARELLESLALPMLAVPGNHDIPYVFPTRFTRTRAEWERVFGTTEPEYTSERLAIVGLNSVRPWRQQGGAVERSQLDRLASRLQHAPEGALRVVALHHHLASPPWRAAHKRPLRRLCRRAPRVRSSRARSTSYARSLDGAWLRATETAAPWRGGRVQHVRVRRGEHHRGHVVVVRPHVCRGRSAGVSARPEPATRLTFVH
jgi:3',5'-cyclic AMP phosphodiesterase CpdA